MSNERREHRVNREPTKRTRRFGKFTLPKKLVDEYNSELLRIMGKCAVFRAEMFYCNDTIEYYATCDRFRNLPEGEIIPEYRWFFSVDGDFWCEEMK